MPKRSVAFIKPPEPKFLKKMKEQMGYQEPDNIETKWQVLPEAQDKDNIEDEEKPTIVALKPGDLTEEEFDKEMALKDVLEDQNKRIVFNKPEKRDSEEASPFVCSSKKAELKKRVKAQNENTKKIKNSSLLSFGDDEEDNDDD